MDKPEKTTDIISGDRIILFLLILLALNLGIHVMMRPDKPVITVKERENPAFSGRIDLNQATAEELAMLPGIGPVRAQQIIEYREKNGGFSKTEEIMNIEGLGSKTFRSIEGMLKVTE